MVGLEDLLPFADRVADLSADFLETAFARGDSCVASFYRAGAGSDDDLVGFSFQSGGCAKVTGQLDILIPAGFRYTYKTWIHPAHRRRNLSQAQGYVRTHARTHAGTGDDGARGMWYVETHNNASLLHSYRHPRDRYLDMGLIGWFSWFGRQIPFRTRRARWLGVELIRHGDLRVRQHTR